MLLGAVVVPVVHSDRAKELRFILDETEAKVLVMPAQLGRDDLLALVLDLWQDLSNREVVAVVGGRGVPTGFTEFETLLECPRMEGPAQVDPSSPT